MSLASMSKGKETETISAMLSIFGIVETRQLRKMFEHLKDAQYGAIIARMHRQHMLWYGYGGKYVALSEHAAKYVDVDKSVMMCWAFLAVKHLVREISSGDGPTFLTFTGRRKEYDLICLNRDTREEIIHNAPRTGDRIRRIFVCSDMSETDGLVFRTALDRVFLVTESGEIEQYEL